METGFSTEIWPLVWTIVYFVVGLVLFGLGVVAMEKVTPFSIRKEIEDDHNTALAVVMAGALIGLAIIIAAAIK
jgi:uncharacterized membrane protein YjfL (UPF0719 family)